MRVQEAGEEGGVRAAESSAGQLRGWKAQAHGVCRLPEWCKGRWVLLMEAFHRPGEDGGAAQDVGHSEFVWLMKELVGQKGTEKESEYSDLQVCILSHLSHIL